MLSVQRSTFRDSQPDSYFARSHVPRISRLSHHTLQQPNSSPAMNTSRKRPRAEPSSHDVVDSFTVRSPATTTDLGASISSIDCLSPAPLANTDYFLSGGVDTPGAWSYQRDEHLELFEAEQDHRWNRFTQKQTQRQPSFYVNGYDKSQNQQQQVVKTSTLNEPQQPQLSSISGFHLRRVAWAMTGGLAGKIFNFCWNTTFRGFSAGGGQAYTTDGRSAITNHPSDGGQYSSYRQRQYNPSDDHQQQQHAAHHGTPTTTSTASRPGMERSVTLSSWVFVERIDVAEREGDGGGDEHSPARKKTRASIAGQSSDWQASGQKDEQPLTLNTNTASFASPWSPGWNSHARTTAHSSTYHGLSPSHNKRQRTSFALTSPIRRQSSQSDLHAVHSLHSSPEVEAFKRQKRRENRRQEESFRRVKAQLQDMIREGKQALGSMVEVIDGREDDHDMDEGCFVDDELCHY